MKISEWLPVLLHRLLSLFQWPDIEPNRTILEIEPAQDWITLEQFRLATGLPEHRASEWYGHVRGACLEYGIVSMTRIAAFLAQIGHESVSFTHTVEIWGPTAAQKRYEGRIDLGNTQPGDGSRYRGRGLIQITGRDNYQRLQDILGAEVVDKPQMLEQKYLAARSAAWWWAYHGCNELADSGDFRALTKRINGGYTGLEDRTRRWEKAKLHLGAA
ncbi:MAG TPA: glycoside hydrolase family 19 protein [Burkholderiaceae bacterium]|nr:glycoside hydrolase family 19 protein [Burkholderiaceae bacterium]